MTEVDRHRTRMTQMRLAPEIREKIQQAALEYDLSINWIVNRAIDAGLPKVLQLLDDLHGKHRS